MQRPLVGDFLDGIKSILSERADNYDGPQKNFERIAALWTAYLLSAGKIEHSKSINESDVAMMMILLKVARRIHSFTEDSLRDIVGYAACDYEIYQQKKNDSARRTASRVKRLLKRILNRK